VAYISEGTRIILTATGNARTARISACEKLDSLASVQLFKFEIIVNNSTLFYLYFKLCLNFK
jgi:hypothetical protein